MSCKSLSLISAMIVFIGISLLTLDSYGADKKKHIFILHSYEKDNVCGQPQHNGVVEAIQNAGFVEGRDFKVSAFYMDTKRKNNTPELIRLQATMAKDEIRLLDPDILVTLDDNAFKTVALTFVDSDMDIVFSGLNGQLTDYNKIRQFVASKSKPGHNVSGVHEKLHIADAIRIHHKLFPMEKVVILVDTSPTGRALSKQIEVELDIAGESLPCKWEKIVIKNWQSYKDNILFANNDPDVGAIYPAVLVLKDKNGKTYTTSEIFAWTVENSKKPEIPINYAFAQMGLFGGAAVDFHSMGIQVGQIIVKVFQGQDIGSIPIEDARKNALVFNLKRANQLGLRIPGDVIMAADDVIYK